MAEKIYFFDDGTKMIADFFDNPEPENIEASFAVEDGMSRLVNRYSLNKGKLVDDYPDDDDEEVCKKEQEAFEGTSAKPAYLTFEYGLHQRPKWATVGNHVNPETGDFLMFPALMQHWVMPFKSKVTRISVSGNLRIVNRDKLPNDYF